MDALNARLLWGCQNPLKCDNDYKKKTFGLHTISMGLFQHAIVLEEYEVHSYARILSLWAILLVSLYQLYIYMYIYSNFSVCDFGSSTFVNKSSFYLFIFYLNYL